MPGISCEAPIWAGFVSFIPLFDGPSLLSDGSLRVAQFPLRICKDLVQSRCSGNEGDLARLHAALDIVSERGSKLVKDLVPLDAR